MLNHHQPCRFGTIKSFNVVKHANSIIITGDKKMDDNKMENGTRQNLEDDEIETETMEEVADGNSGGTAGIIISSDSRGAMADSYIDEKTLGNELHRQGEFSDNIKSEEINDGRLDADKCHPGGLARNSAAGAQLDTEMASEDLALEIEDKTVSQQVPKLMNTSKDESHYCSDQRAGNTQNEATNSDKILAAEEKSNPGEVDGKLLPEDHTEAAVEHPASQSVPVTISEESPRMLDALKEKPDSQYDKVANNIQREVINEEKKSLPEEDLKLEEGNQKLQKDVGGSQGCLRMESDTIEMDASRKENNLEKKFEPGCVFVEYRRIESSCIAAHCIHGRLFDNRIVTVEYIDPDLYRLKFPK